MREVVPLRNGRRHGVVRVWHKNGVLANEERYQNGLLQRRTYRDDRQLKCLGELTETDFKVVNMHR